MSVAEETRNITFNLPSDLIDRARVKAKNLNSSLNTLFRGWLESFAGAEQVNLDDILNNLQYVDTGGQKFSRDELNER